MNDNRNLLTALIVIGIIIIIILIAPTLSRNLVAYRGTSLTASTTDLTPNYYTNTNRDYYYTIHRSVPRTTSTTTYPGTTTTYTYTTTPSSYEYYYPGNTTYYSDGCSPTSAYSATTGAPCS